jgi:hypothetical protein
VQRIKCKQLDLWQYQNLNTDLELLTGTKKNCKNWIGNGKLLTIHGHQPKADVDCLHVPKKWGGRGLMQLDEAYAVEITKLVDM